MKHTKLKSLFLVLTFLSLFSLFGCSFKKSSPEFEQKALNWVNLEAQKILDNFPENVKKNIVLKDQFYILNSFNYKNGYCIEIASKARNPPRVDEDNFYDPTTLPLFINADNKIEFSNLDCFAKVYKNSGWKYLQKIQKDFDAENKKDYSIFHYILTREVGMIVLKTKLMQKMGN